MPEQEKQTVSMRVRIGDAELEVSGPREFVEKKISDFLKEQRGQQPPHGMGRAPTPGPSGVQPPTSHGKAMSAAQFFKKASPKSDVDRALLAGYFLEKHGVVDSFSTAEIVDTIRQARIKPPVNPSDSIAKNIKKGLMMPAGDKEGKRAFVLTSDGEDQVAAALNEAP